MATDPDTEQETMDHKTLAESKFNCGDLKSALKHARKALSLSPSAEGLSSMVTAFEVIISAADSDTRGTPDWYKILQVEPFSHINIIKQRYKKLALVLHPDKNQYIGCEEAFKLVNEAFRVFSDRIRRTEYDMKLRIRIQEERINGDSGDNETQMFWTACSDCKLQQKFDRKYLGQNLMCPNCKKSFEAKEEEDKNGGCLRDIASKIITYSRRKNRVDDNGEKLIREERTKASNSSLRLDEEDEGMMTLAEMQTTIKRKKQKVNSKITEKDNTEIEETMEMEASASDVSLNETLMEMSTNKFKNRKKKKMKHKVTETLDLDYMKEEDFETYDFDKDRNPRRFKKGQIWAVYDGGDDKMPRNYCLICEVISLNPFKVVIRWLDFEREKMQISSHMSCGSFLVSEKAFIEQMKPFSHLVDCERAALGKYQIYPRKGSIWAVYADTNPCLKRRNARRYEIVVCLTTYSDAYGLSLAYLEKINGCSNQFKRREYGANAVRWFEKDDVIPMLSHQMPARKLLEDESLTGLKESWVLDSASVPPDLVLNTW